jgi:hypothetical protein
VIPLPPRDALRLAEDRAQMLHEAWPRELRLRSATAIRLRRLAAWLDPPAPPCAVERPRHAPPLDRRRSRCLAEPPPPRTERARFASSP